MSMHTKLINSTAILLLIFYTQSSTAEIESFEQITNFSSRGNTNCTRSNEMSSDGRFSLKISIQKHNLLFKHSICTFKINNNKLDALNLNSVLYFDAYNESLSETRHKLAFVDKDNKRWVVPILIQPKQWSSLSVDLWRSKGIIDIAKLKNISIITTRSKNKKKLYIDNFLAKNITPDDKKSIELSLLRPASRGVFFLEKSQLKNIKIGIQIRAKLSSYKNHQIEVSLHKSETDTVLQNAYITNIINENNTIVLSNAPLAPSQFYYVKVSVLDRGNLVLQKYIDIRTLVPASNFVSTDSNGVILINNKPFFPIGMFNTPADEIPLVSSEGFNAVHSYNPVDKRYLDLAADNDIYVLTNIKRKYNNKTKMYHTFPADNEALTRYVRKLQSSSHLLGYYYFDEPSPSGVSRQELKSVSQYISLLDPNHLNLGVINRFQEFYHSSSDAVMVNDYPIPGRLAPIVNKFKLLNSRISPNKAVLFLAQAYNKETHFMHSLLPTRHGRLRSPTFDESRTMSWLAISQGAKGIFFYSYHTQGFYLRNAFPWSWHGLTEHAKELNVLTSWITSESKDTVGVVKNKHLNVGMKRRGDDFLYIVSNLSNKEIYGKVTLKCKADVKSPVFVVSEGRQVKHNNCAFNDSFDPFETHLYTSDKELFENDQLQDLSYIRSSIAKIKAQHDSDNPSSFNYQDGSRLYASWGFPNPELVNRKIFYRMIDGYPGTQWVIGNKSSKADIPGWEKKDFISDGRWIEVRSSDKKNINKIRVISSSNLDFKIELLINNHWIEQGSAVVSDRQYHHKYDSKTTLAKFEPTSTDRFRIVLAEKGANKNEVIFELSAWHGD